MEKGSRGRSDTSRRLKEAAGFCGIRKEKPLGCENDTECFPDVSKGKGQANPDLPL